jgi:hypothetical protein
VTCQWLDRVLLPLLLDLLLLLFLFLQSRIVKNGVEKFVKSGQLAANEDTLIFSSDMTKGYNNILRTITWLAVQQIGYDPLTQLFIFLYGTSPTLNYVINPLKKATADNIRKVLMKIGLPQGDSLSGFLFSITLNYVLQEFWARHHAHRQHIGFDSVLDDIKMAIAKAKWDIAGQLISDFIITLSAHNFNINLSKSELYSKLPSALLSHQTSIINAKTFNAGLRIGDLRLNTAGFSVCRVPVGSNSFINSFIKDNYHPRISDAFERFRYLWKAIDRIPREKFNTFFVFVRLCFSSKFLYWLRTLLPIHARPIASIIDDNIDALMEQLYPQRPECPPPNAEFNEQLEISKLIERLPLSKGGAGVMRTLDIQAFCYIASVAESFSYIHSYGECIGIYPPEILNAPEGTAAKRHRERLFPGFTSVSAYVISLSLTNTPPAFFEFSSKEVYVNVQGALTTSFHTLLQKRILNRLDQPSYKGWFEGGKEQYTSFTLNSQVRHITSVRPPHDSIFRMVLSMRILRPLFFNATCKCGETYDFCGHHALRCQHTPYTTIHHSVRDGVIRWMEMYIKRQHNSPMKTVSEKQSSTQCQVGLYYTVSPHPRDNMPTGGRRADGIVWCLNDPMRPWIIDFVQLQTNSADSSTRLRDFDKKYNDKVRTYSDSHPTMPLSRIIPFVFTSDGVLHPKTEEFMDWFICKAASEELREPPSKDKISFRHTFLSALQDKTAFTITSCFETHLKESHAALFPTANLDLFNQSRLYAELPLEPRPLHDSLPSSSPPPVHPDPSHPLASPPQARIVPLAQSAKSSAVPPAAPAPLESRMARATHPVHELPTSLPPAIFISDSSLRPRVAPLRAASAPRINPSLEPTQLRSSVTSTPECVSAHFANDPSPSPSRRAAFSGLVPASPSVLFGVHTRSRAGQSAVGGLRGGRGGR